MIKVDAKYVYTYTTEAELSWILNKLPSEVSPIVDKILKTITYTATQTTTI